MWTHQLRQRVPDGFLKAQQKGFTGESAAGQNGAIATEVIAVDLSARFCAMAMIVQGADREVRGVKQVASTRPLFGFTLADSTPFAAW